MFVTMKINIENAMRVNRQKEKETRNKLVIIVTIFKTLKSENWL